jgi:predicted 3-demethylubiquinone-9 3-methyltransferase (glyoxalase superfamily)
MSKISPCLWFKDQAEEAARFYVSLLPGSHIDHVQKDVRDEDGSVLVVEFTLAGQSHQALNGGMHIEYNNALSLSVTCEDQAEVDRLWDALGDGGTPHACGWIKDRYGVPWQIVPSVLPKMLADPDPARARRVMQAMLGMVKIDIVALEAAYEGKLAA